MFRNMYDTDVTVWSPEGRLLQVSVRLVVGGVLPGLFRSVAPRISHAHELPLGYQSLPDLIFRPRRRRHPNDHPSSIRDRSNTPWSPSSRVRRASPSGPTPTPSSARSSDPCQSCRPTSRRYSRSTTTSASASPDSPPTPGRSRSG